MRPIYILLYKIGPISYLPNGPAQAQNFYGAISPTHRRSKYAKMNLQLKSGWYKCFATQKDYLLKITLLKMFLKKPLILAMQIICNVKK